MKKLLLTAAAVFAFSFANAQDSSASGEGFSKGNVMLSGSVGVNSEKTGEDKASGFNFSPRAGFFVTDNIAVGVALGFSSTKQEDSSPIEDKKTDFSAGVFGRYYFTPASKFSVFGQLGVNMNSYKNESTNNVSGLTLSSKGSGFGVALAPGVSYFLSNHFALEATWGVLGFDSSKPDATGADTTTNVDFGLDLNDLNFGLVYKF